MIHVLDYGSQYTQLIAKRLRRQGFASQVLPGTTPADKLPSKAQSIILSGSPASVGEGLDPDPKLLEQGVPVLDLNAVSHAAVAALRGSLDLVDLWRRPEADAIAMLHEGRVQLALVFESTKFDSSE